ncbi:MAG: hypothetical protein ACE5GI_05080, partial [Candidatus Aminicenantales bacterium]
EHAAHIRSVGGSSPSTAILDEKSLIYFQGAGDHIGQGLIPGEIKALTKSSVVEQPDNLQSSWNLKRRWKF